MKTSYINRIYISLYMRYCKLTNKKFLKRYIVIYKHGNKIGYFTDAIGINKRDVISKVRILIFYSGFFNDLKNINDIKKIEIIAIENTEE